GVVARGLWAAGVLAGVLGVNAARGDDPPPPDPGLSTTEGALPFTVVLGRDDPPVYEGQTGDKPARLPAGRKLVMGEIFFARRGALRRSELVKSARLRNVYTEVLGWVPRDMLVAREPLTVGEAVRRRYLTKETAERAVVFGISADNSPLRVMKLDL